MKGYSRLIFHVVAVALLLCFSHVYLTPASADIENGRFKVSLSPQTGLITVYDKSAKTTWVQCPVEGVAISNIKESGKEISFTINAKLSCTIEVSDTSIDLSIDGKAEDSFENMNYPGGFVAKGAKDQALVLPNGSGLMIPFSMADDPNLEKIVGRSYPAMVGQVGVTMPWVGIANGEAASMMLALTPWDAEFMVVKAKGGYGYSLQWLSVKGKLGYARKVRYQFADKGGYVALCKMYREHAKQEGLIVTLRDKAKQVPEVDKLVGAMSFWVDDPPDINFVKEMKDAGIAEQLLSYHVRSSKFGPEDRARKGVYLTYESVTRDFADQAHALGLLVGRYDHFYMVMGGGGGGRPAGAPQEGAPVGMKKAPVAGGKAPAEPQRGGTQPDAQKGKAPAGMRKGAGAAKAAGAPPGEGAPQAAKAPTEQRIDPSGVLTGYVPRAMGYPEQSVMRENGEFDRIRCPKMQFEMSQVYIPGDVDRVGYDARLMDQICAEGLVECYSPNHPVTRKDDIEYRFKLLKFNMDYGLLSSTEHIGAWAVPTLHYAEAPPSFARLYPPSQRIGTVLDSPTPIPEIFWKTKLNEQIRVPLWQLVFHDCVIITNRWNETPNQYEDPKAWDKDDLFCILDAQMPTITIDKAHWQQQKARLAQSFKNVCIWNNEIGYEEMVNHRFLTKDKKVQESIFETKRVIVNFGDKQYKAQDGTIIAPMGYKVFNR